MCRSEYDANRMLAAARGVVPPRPANRRTCRSLLSRIVAAVVGVRYA